MAKLDAVKALTDDFGIWQHTKGSLPDRAKGYALDDATRGLLLYLVTQESGEAATLLHYLNSSYQDGQWYGLATAERTFTDAPASEDAVGQVAWAAALAQTHGLEPALARNVFEQAKSALAAPHYLRGSAYALLGASYIDPEWADRLAQDVIRRFSATTPDWPWPERILNYGNAIVPLALLRYGRLYHNNEAIELGSKSLAFIDQACRLNQPFGPIGNKGWFEAGMPKPTQFSQQPIDAAYMVWAYLAAYEIDHDDEQLEQAKDWLSWFHGNNVAKMNVGDSASGLCFDGIDGPEKIRLSRNSGAESRVCYSLSLWAIEQQKSF